MHTDIKEGPFSEPKRFILTNEMHKTVVNVKPNICETKHQLFHFIKGY